MYKIDRRGGSKNRILGQTPILYMHLMDKVGHVAAVPGPLAYPSRSAWPLSCPSRSARSRNCPNLTLKLYKLNFYFENSLNLGHVQH